MEDYLMKHARSGINVLFSQLTSQMSYDASPIEFIDPLTTIIKLALISLKSDGIKLSIQKNRIEIHEPWLLQGFQRWLRKDDKDQLHQLRIPLLYFRGIVLGYHQYEHLHIHQEILDKLNKLAIDGLKKLKLTYDDKTGSLVENNLDGYIQSMHHSYSLIEYTGELVKMNKPILFAIYNEYTKMWEDEDFHLIMQLFLMAEKEEDAKIKNQWADCIDHYVKVKDLKMDTIRPK